MIFISKIVQLLYKMFLPKGLCLSKKSIPRKRKNITRRLPCVGQVSPKKPRYEQNHNPSTDMVPLVGQVPPTASTNDLLAENIELKRLLESSKKEGKKELLIHEEKINELLKVISIQSLEQENMF